MKIKSYLVRSTIKNADLGGEPLKSRAAPAVKNTVVWRGLSRIILLCFDSHFSLFCVLGRLRSLSSRIDAQLIRRTGAFFRQKIASLDFLPETAGSNAYGRGG
ncbi:hypothetical protein [uncultured Bacteroides sp.]|uniref:hypothetical protein n=1 Tax=uncultured Bacteroides sp. TaxID=162156 RepID=UPI002638670F|nr:hypothetical protein [uncultured Bacteroides sp.]